MLAGDIFRRGGMKWRIMIFKTIYYITAAFNFTRAWSSCRRRKRTRSVTFSGETTLRQVG
jgi:hypothetical protein